MKTLYRVDKSPGGVEGEWTMRKLDGNFNILADPYLLSQHTGECSCPQGQKLRGTKHQCKHWKFLGIFAQNGHIGDGYMLDADTRMWVDPIIGETELDGLILGAPKEVPFQSTEDKLVNVVAPAIATETKPTGFKRRRFT